MTTFACFQQNILIIDYFGDCRARLRLAPKKIDGFLFVKIETAAPPFGRLAVTVEQHFVSDACRFEAEVLAMTNLHFLRRRRSGDC